MKNIFIILCLIIIHPPAFTQQKRQQYIYIPDSDKYVLSEQLVAHIFKGTPVPFNSLFIWQKDKVIRVLFHYQSAIPENGITPSAYTKLETIIPVIKKYKLYQKKEGGYYTTGNLLDNITETGKKDNEIPGNADDLYKQKVLIAINRWNKKHNPGADVFAKIIVSDSDPYIIQKNKSRKKAFANNLPLVFRLPGNDSFFVAKPYLIDIYRLNDANTAVQFNTRLLSGYTLYSRISLLDESFMSDAVKQDDELPAYAVEKFIAAHTMGRLYKFNENPGQDQLINQLASLPLSAQQTLAANSNNGTPQHDPCAGQPVNPFPIAYPSPVYNLYEADDRGNTGKQDCYSMYQYCQNCYEQQTPIKQRIAKHCPFSPVQGVGNEWETEHWSYVYTVGNNHFFKKKMYNGNTECNSPGVWQFFSPGIGFWLSDATHDNTGRYFTPNPETALFRINKHNIKY